MVAIHHTHCVLTVCWSASSGGAAQVSTGDPGAGGRGAGYQPSRPVRLGDTTGHLLDRMQLSIHT